jgi:hypothetical protein
MKTSSFMQLFAISFLAVIGVFFCGCNETQMKSAIKQYRGQGVIQVLPAPLFGAPGYRIEMPVFDLSKPLNVEYRLDGIPRGKYDYTIYLVVPKPCPFDSVSLGLCSFEMKKDGKIIKMLTSQLKDITAQEDFDKYKFYFYDNNAKNYLSIDDATSKWSLVVVCTNSILTQNVKAHIEISEGGEK